MRLSYIVQGVKAHNGMNVIVAHFNNWGGVNDEGHNDCSGNLRMVDSGDAVGNT